MSSNNYQVIIVGQGIAGTLLSYQLHKNGIKHLVIDQQSEYGATRVAAGLINPFMLKWGRKVKNGDEYLQYADALYRELETFLQTRFYYPTAVNKLFKQGDRELWEKQMKKRKFADEVELSDRDLSAEGISSKEGYVSIKTTARIDFNVLLDAYRCFLKSQSVLLEESFDESELQVNLKGVKYKQYSANQIIFCRGAWESRSEMFPQVEFEPSKGEVLFVKCPSLNLSEIISKDIFLMPVEDGCFKVGASYSNQCTDIKPTLEKKEELIRKLDSFLLRDYEVLDQYSGIRPILTDRKPICGFVGESPLIGIFNGLGSRGGLMAPLYSKLMSIDILQKDNLLGSFN